MVQELLGIINKRNWLLHGCIKTQAKILFPQFYGSTLQLVSA